MVKNSLIALWREAFHPSDESASDLRLGRVLGRRQYQSLLGSLIQWRTYPATNCLSNARRGHGTERTALATDQGAQGLNRHRHARTSHIPARHHPPTARRIPERRQAPRSTSCCGISSEPRFDGGTTSSNDFLDHEEICPNVQFPRISEISEKPKHADEIRLRVEDWAASFFTNLRTPLLPRCRVTVK